MKKLHLINFLLVYFFTIFLTQELVAKTFTTKYDGNWKDTAIWKNGEVPNYTTSDTILIYNMLKIDSTITFYGDSYVFVDTMGGICGHDTLWIKDNCKFDNYGNLQFDVELMTGGHYENMNTGFIIINYYSRFTGGVMNSCGDYWVDYWDDCYPANYSPTIKHPTNSIEDDHFFRVFPVPVINELSINYSDSTEISTTEFYSIKILNTSGSIVYEGPLNASNERVNCENLYSGMYYAIISNGRITTKHKFIKL